jgi:ubiquinone/menaquinone biosynthesis C-methylase UbiE
MKDGSISNLRTRKQQDIIDEYAASTELQPSKKAILDRLRDRLRQMKMLDIGVGGGRTTMHFAQAAEEYWAIDYSEEMIAACRERFRVAFKKDRFLSAMRGPSIFAPIVFFFHPVQF